MPVKQMSKDVYSSQIGLNPQTLCPGTNPRTKAEKDKDKAERALERAEREEDEAERKREDPKNDD